MLCVLSLYLFRVWSSSHRKVLLLRPQTVSQTLSYRVEVIFLILCQWEILERSKDGPTTSMDYCRRTRRTLDCTVSPLMRDNNKKIKERERKKEWMIPVVLEETHRTRDAEKFVLKKHMGFSKILFPFSLLCFVVFPSCWPREDFGLSSSSHPPDQLVLFLFFLRHSMEKNNFSLQQEMTNSLLFCLLLPFACKAKIKGKREYFLFPSPFFSIIDWVNYD